MDKDSLAHTKWNCKYHVVFAPKYRRRVIYKHLKQDIGNIIRMLCQRKGIEIIQAEACPDHIHMLITIPPKYSVSSVMGYLKGKSTLLIFERHADLIQIWTETLLVSRLLCRYSRKEYKGNKRLYIKSDERRQIER